jgi:hypothetical protein
MSPWCAIAFFPVFGNRGFHDVLFCPISVPTMRDTNQVTNMRTSTCSKNSGHVIGIGIGIGVAIAIEIGFG